VGQNIPIHFMGYGIFFSDQKKRDTDHQSRKINIAIEVRCLGQKFNKMCDTPIMQGPPYFKI